MVSDITLIGIFLTILFSIGVPIAALLVPKIRKRAKILLFLVGVSMHLLFVMLLERFFLGAMAGFFPAVAQNPWLYSLMSGAAAMIFETAEFVLIIRALLPQLERGSQPMMFAMGHAASNGTLSAGLTAMTYYSIGVIVNTDGAEELTKGLTGDELAFVNGMIQDITGDYLPFYINAVNQLLLITMYACLAVMLWLALGGYLEKKWVAVAAGVFFLLRFLMDLGNTGGINLWVSAGLSFAVTVAFAFLTRRMYVQTEDVRPRVASQSRPRLR